MSGPFAVDPRHPAPRPDPASRPGLVGGSRRSWALLWLPGFAVAIGAAVATAHGLFEVVVASRVPAGIAWIYPLITDGLALVAYTATARLHGSAARYAWSVVVLAAGLSGLAQAVYLAADTTPAPGAGAPGGVGGGAAVALTIDPALRFGVGAWPAVAAAIVAHLLYLMASVDTDASTEHGPDATAAGAARPVSSVHPVQPVHPVHSVHSVQPSTAMDTGPDGHRPVDARALPTAAGPALSTGTPRPAVQPSSDPAPSTPEGDQRCADSPVRDRARAAAARHLARHGALPTVRDLMAIAEVSRGTAAAALQQLREQPGALHLVPESPESPESPDKSEASTQR